MSDQACRSTYQGDETLARLLEKAGIKTTPQEVKSLLAGIAAAPDRPGDRSWLALIIRDPSPALEAQLTALRAELARPAEGPPRDRRLAALRAALARHGLAGFLIPRADEHQGEYVARQADRLNWLTGFTGSAGLAIVLADKAAVFIDGRYTLQVRTEVDGAHYEYRHLIDEPPADWIAGALKPGDRLGYDPWLHTVEGLARLREGATRAGAELVPVARNLVDEVWSAQPPRPLGPVVPHALAHAGRLAADKRAEIGAIVAKGGADAAVLSAPDSIAWLLNMRGDDIPHVPVALAFATIDAAGHVDLFIDRRKLAPGTVEHLGNGVVVRAPDELGPALDALAAAGKRVRVDPASAPSWVFDRLKAAGAEAKRAEDPCALPKACKNPTELDGIRRAHRRDGLALTRFLAWLAEAGPTGEVTELDAAARLRALRAEQELFHDLSFETIPGAGPNGAIVHYRSSPATNRPLKPGELFLLDSGAQYQDGTTDVTRTIAVGTPDAEQRDRFTRVLKGHIALGSARFPRGTSGAQLDALARLPLWQAGLDYDHGTGHGVGCFLSVHEGPQRISKVPSTVALRPGMVVSNEPGYYKTGAYGIRIENLVTVVEAEKPPGGERELLAFETLTLAPIDLALVEPGLLTAEEIAWLNAYHARVRTAHLPGLDAKAAAWLDHATRAI
jgi:Xaa-Pro aminopeptidase